MRITHISGSDQQHCICGRARAFVVHISHDGHNRHGKKIRINTMRSFCEGHAARYAQRFGLELPQ